MSSLYRPQSSSHFSRPQRDLPRSHPPTPPTLPSVPVPIYPSQPINPIRKITPPEEKEDRKLATANEYKSPYDKAYAYFQECTARSSRFAPYAPRPLEDYDSPLAIRMSRNDWVKLRSDLNLGEIDEAYPRLSYNALTSTLIIQCMPGPLHQSISSALTEEFIMSKANLPKNLRDQTKLKWEEDCNHFGDQWEDSEKRPDLSIKVRNAEGQFEMKWVLEVGFSETYQQLVEDAQLWLEGNPSVSMVTLVKFCETPKYRCPVSLDEDDDNNPESLGIPLNLIAIDRRDIILEGEYGPAIYKGRIWVGVISRVFSENWILDADGKAIQYGDREELMQAAQLQIPIGDLMPPGYPRMLTLNLDEFRTSLRQEIPELAAHRCRSAVKEYKKRTGQGQHDGDYQP